MAARYFVAKCDNIGRLYKAKETSVWACSDRKTPPQPKDVLSEAFDVGPVILIFSANNCHGWHGYATMLSKPGSVGLQEDSQDERGRACSPANDDVSLDASLSKAEEKSTGSPIVWQKFRIQWEKLFLTEHGENCLPFTQTGPTSLPSSDISLNKARNLQELPCDIGQMLCNMINQHYEYLCNEKKLKLEEKRLKLGDSFFQPGLEKDPMLIWARILGKVKSLGTVLLACAFGSQRYNLHTPESDMDMFIVYAADTKDILGFDPPKSTIKNRDTDTCDYTIHELHRYCELLLSGDPRCVETLFLHPDSVYLVTEEWLQLCSHKKKFLTRSCLEKYLRDATGAKGLNLLNKWTSSGEALQIPVPSKVCKLFYIIIRLLQNAKDIATCADLRVYRESGCPRRDLLMSVRQGKLTYGEMKEQIDELLSDIEQLKQQNEVKLEDKKSQVKQVMECWLLLIRYRSLEKYMQKKL